MLMSGENFGDTGSPQIGYLRGMQNREQQFPRVCGRNRRGRVDQRDLSRPMREDVASAIYKGGLVQKVHGRPAVLGHLTRRSRFSLNNDLVDQRWTTVEKFEAITRNGAQWQDGLSRCVRETSHPLRESCGR